MWSLGRGLLAVVKFSQRKRGMSGGAAAAIDTATRVATAILIARILLPVDRAGRTAVADPFAARD
jgi:hypothetical protein